MKQQDDPKGDGGGISPLFAWIAMGLSLLIPGAGFILVGRVGRGLAHMIAIGATWALGLAFHATVVWPVWEIGDENFNIISNFTFIVQLGAGLPALACFWANVSSGGAPGLLAGIPHHAFFELGGYFLIVAGALNYFALGNFYDRIINTGSRFRAQETGENPCEDGAAPDPAATGEAGA